ncbi:hypothetical protein AB0J80_11635 [Actinoplanes sp. NPDC049548]|uniref:hypothetical protein n=1 Tax=Actinoplanes sp. NPDC049548 TaxID=3155152 RepID=UPI0034346510
MSWASPSGPPPAADGPPLCLVTVGHSDDRVTAHAVDWEPLEVFSYGPDLVPALPAALTADDLPAPIPRGGVHLELPARTVGVWGGDAPDGTTAQWSGWSVRFWTDDCTEQLRRASGTPLFVPQVDWAYEAMRQSLTARHDDPAPFLHEWYGAYFRAPVWDLSPSQVEAALTAVATAARSG